MEKPVIGLFTSVIDNRKARGTALAARKFLENLRPFEDQFSFVLVHSEPCDDPLYSRYPEILIPQLPGLFNKQLLNEIVFWLMWRFGKKKFDIFHYLHPRIWPSYLLTPAKKVLVTAYEGGIMLDIYTPTFGDRIFRFTNRYLHWRMDALIAASESGKKEITELYHVPAEKVHVVHLGVEDSYAPPSDRSAARARLEIRYGITGRYMLAVSRFDPHKNILRLLEAYGDFRTAHHDIKLILVGGNHTPGYSEQVQALIRKLDPQEQLIRILSFVEDVDMPALYALANALVYPSLHEGFGLPVLEAMACGTPVIASNTTSIPEITGGAGILIDPEDASAISGAMVQVADDALLREKLSRAGIARAADFRWKESARKTIDLYGQLLKRS